MKHTTIYLVRHAEAEGNICRRIHGQYDSNVTVNGLRQLAALEERFRDVSVDAVYASDLNRTMRTAAAVADPKGMEVHPDARFREIGIGVWEDVPYGELAKHDGKRMTQFNQKPDIWSVEGSETFAVAAERFLSGLRDVADAHRGETVVITSHGSIMAHSLKQLFPDTEMCHMDNTSVSKLTFDGAFHLEFLGDNSHLPEEISTLARQNWWRKDPSKQDRNLWFMPYETEIDWYLRLTDDTIPVAPMAVITFAMLDDTPIGLLQLDPQRDQEEKVGFIDYIGLQKKSRNQALGIQLIGEAISYYRKLGREKLRVCLPERYARQRAWFERYGFVSVGEDLYDLNICVPNGL